MLKRFHIHWPSFIAVCVAPASVLVFHEIVGHLGIRRQFDHQLHFSGGLTIAIFIYVVIRIASPILGELTQAARYFITFAGACTAALFWEFGEFASDVLRGTHTQQSDTDTMLDLVFGTLGATCALLMIAVIRRVRRPSPR
jgi:hypothetical protein